MHTCVTADTRMRTCTHAIKSTSMLAHLQGGTRMCFFVSLAGPATSIAPKLLFTSPAKFLSDLCCFPHPLCSRVRAANGNHSFFPSRHDFQNGQRPELAGGHAFFCAVSLMRAKPGKSLRGKQNIANMPEKPVHVSLVHFSGPRVALQAQCNVSHGRRKLLGGMEGSVRKFYRKVDLRICQAKFKLLARRKAWR